MRRIQRSLDQLLEEGYISGYNYFPKVISESKYNLLLSHFHESPEYLLDVFRDLQMSGYPNSNVIVFVRKKYSFTKWRASYKIKDDFGNVFPGLKIRSENNYLNLAEIQSETLKDIFPENYIERLIGEAEGYEIKLGCDNKEDLIKNALNFYNKSNPLNLFRWKDAYDTPAIIIEDNLDSLEESIEGFFKAKIAKKKTPFSEYNFVFKVLNKKIEYLILRENFKSHFCLINDLFFNFV